MPSGLESYAAAALPVAGLTARGVLERLALPAGATLLVVGATEVPGTQVLPFDEAARAFEESRGGHMRGKTVLAIAPLTR